MASIYTSPAGEQAVLDLYTAALASWPVPFTTAHVSTRYGSTFAVMSGEHTAPPLVLLHGAGTNATMWAGDVTAYSRHFRVVALDLLGEPGHSAPVRPSWTGPAYADWLADVLAALKLERVTIVGLSQGAWVALKFAVAYPERVTALVLLGPGGIVPDKASFVLRALPLLVLGRWGKRRIARLVLGDEAIPVADEDAMVVRLSAVKPRVGALPLFSDGDLERVTMPVQLVMGGRDVLRDGQRIAARLGRVLPQLTVTMLPEAGHALVGARADVLAFLARAPGSAVGDAHSR